MSDEVSSKEIIKLARKKYKISEIYDVTTTTDDGGRVLDINTHFYEEAERMRKVLPSKFEGYKVTVSYYAK